MAGATEAFLADLAERLGRIEEGVNENAASAATLTTQQAVTAVTVATASTQISEVRNELMELRGIVLDVERNRDRINALERTVAGHLVRHEESEREGSRDAAAKHVFNEKVKGHLEAADEDERTGKTHRYEWLKMAVQVIAAAVLAIVGPKLYAKLFGG